MSSFPLESHNSSELSKEIDMRFNRLGAFTLGVVITAVSVGAVSFVNAASNGTLKACANKTTGVMRYISKGSCKKTERTLTWNQMGSQGLPGTAGVSGAAGATGAQGDAGVNGKNAVTTPIATGENCIETKCTYKIGDKGPAGGLIFFIDRFDDYANYDYLEAAPTDGIFNGNLTYGEWATNTANCGESQNADCQLNSIYPLPELGTAIVVLRGSHRGLFGGKAATLAIVARHDAGSVAKNLYAAGVADVYTANGKSDWWLPSDEELTLMHENLNNRGLGGFAFGSYWSSSETWRDGVWSRMFFNGRVNELEKFGQWAVRPVRAF
jgi:hypothetical protein